jgi:transcription elongation factor
VAGVLDREPLSQGLAALVQAADFQPGDRVRTLRGSLKGVVKEVRPDGRVVWQPDVGAELMALPESLLREP